MRILTKVCWFVFLAELFALPLDNEERKINPEEVANEYEGDIVLSNDPLSRTGRNGLMDLSRRWQKNAYGQVIVPYKIQTSYCK